MSEQIYTIKESTLQEMANLVKQSSDYWQDKEISIPELIEEIEFLINFKKQSDDWLQGHFDNHTLYIPRDITKLIDLTDRDAFGSNYGRFTGIVWQLPQASKGSEPFKRAFEGMPITTLSIPNFQITYSADYGLGRNVASNCTYLKEVEWGGDYNISTESFYNCKNLERFSFKIEDSTNKLHIWNRAFYNCEKLQSFDFNKINQIEGGAFYNCKALLEVNLKDIYTITSSSDKGIFESSGVQQLKLGGTTKLSNYMFKNTTKLDTLILDYENIQNWTSQELFKNSNIKNIIKARGVGGTDTIDGTELIGEVGDFCFAGASLENVHCFSSLSKIGDYAFAGLTGCTELELPLITITYNIGEAPFSSKIPGEEGPDSTLTTLILSAKNFVTGLFKDSNIKTIKYRGNLNDWNNSKLSDKDWPFLKSSTLLNSDGTTSINPQLYIYDDEENFVEPKGILGDSVDSDLPYTIDIETLNSHTFQGYKNFGSFKFTNNLKVIKSDAFKGAEILDTRDRIIFDFYLKDYFNLVFENEYSNPFSASQGNSNTYAMRTIMFKHLSGTYNYFGNSITDATLRYDKDGESLSLTEIIIPKNAFANTPPFVSINIGSTGSGVTFIEFGEKSFYQSAPQWEYNSYTTSSGWQKKTIPSGVNQIRTGYAPIVKVGNQAFYNNVKLSIFIGPTGQGSNTIEIGEEAFYNCEKLTNGKSSGIFTLPIIKTIGDRAFYGCTSLVEVILGSENNPVESIGADAFAQCTGMGKITIYYDNSLYTEDTFNTMPNYPWGLSDTITIEGIGTTKTTSEV